MLVIHIQPLDLDIIYYRLNLFMIILSKNQLSLIIEGINEQRKIQFIIYSRWFVS